MDDSQFDILMKMIIIGDSSVGKTNLMNRFALQEYKSECRPTVGMEFATRHINHKGKVVKAHIWDTAGQEKFRSITQAYYRGCLGALVCFDLSNEKTFHNVDKWIQDLHNNANEGIKIILIGCKADLPRKVTEADAIAKAQQYNIAYLETSALKAKNVMAAFQQLISCFIAKLSKKSTMKWFPRLQYHQRELRPQLSKLKRKKNKRNHVADEKHLLHICIYIIISISLLTIKLNFSSGIKFSYSEILYPFKITGSYRLTPKGPLETFKYRISLSSLSKDVRMGTNNESLNRIRQFWKSIHSIRGSVEQLIRENLESMTNTLMPAIQTANQAIKHFPLIPPLAILAQLLLACFSNAKAFSFETTLTIYQISIKQQNTHILSGIMSFQQGGHINLTVGIFIRNQRGGRTNNLYWYERKCSTFKFIYDDIIRL